MKRPDFTQRAFPVLDIVEVHDGDTYRLLLDRGGEDAWFPWLRLKDYSCPELDTIAGQAAKLAAATLLQAHAATLWVVTFRAKRPVVAKTFVDDQMALTRYLGQVWLDDDLLLGDLLVAGGYAKSGSHVG